VERLEFLPDKFVIAVDFDGTITEEKAMSHQMTLRPHCKEVLTWLANRKDVVLVLWTCRTAESLYEAMKFLKQHNMLDLFAAVNDQLPEVKKKYHPKVARKVGADIYIDDRNLYMSTVDWKDIQKVLQKTFAKRMIQL
jgi:hydroxymethylpyrimidine pyrophosphatase-like HAD family hydrolase